MAPKAIPDRWEPYIPIGSPIRGTRFVALKVPLKEHVCANLEPKFRWTIDILTSSHPNIGMIVDFTLTTRYYDYVDFLNKGVDYCKVAIPGQQIPSEQLVKRFFAAVDYYLDRHRDGSLIGIHCTHGVNRTGYMIARYMIQRLGFSVSDALESIAVARGHPIERENYISDLGRHLERIPKCLDGSDIHKGRAAGEPPTMSLGVKVAPKKKPSEQKTGKETVKRHGLARNDNREKPGEWKKQRRNVNPWEPGCGPKGANDFGPPEQLGNSRRGVNVNKRPVKIWENERNFDGDVGHLEEEDFPELIEEQFGSFPQDGGMERGGRGPPRKRFPDKRPPPSNFRENRGPPPHLREERSAHPFREEHEQFEDERSPPRFREDRGPPHHFRKERELLPFRDERPEPFRDERRPPNKFREERRQPSPFREECGPPPLFREERGPPPPFREERKLLPSFREEHGPPPPPFREERGPPPPFREQRGPPPPFRQERSHFRDGSPHSHFQSGRDENFSHGRSEDFIRHGGHRELGTRGFDFGRKDGRGRHQDDGWKDNDPPQPEPVGDRKGFQARRGSPPRKREENRYNQRPPPRTTSPPGRQISPRGRRMSPPGRGMSPSQDRRMSPRQGISPPSGRRPPGRRMSPQGRMPSPGRRISPLGRRMSPPRSFRVATPPPEERIARSFGRMSPQPPQREFEPQLQHIGFPSQTRRMSPPRGEVNPFPGKPGRFDRPSEPFPRSRSPRALQPPGGHFEERGRQHSPGGMRRSRSPGKRRSPPPKRRGSPLHGRISPPPFKKDSRQQQRSGPKVQDDFVPRKDSRPPGPFGRNDSGHDGRPRHDERGPPINKSPPRFSNRGNVIDNPRVRHFEERKFPIEPEHFQRSIQSKHEEFIPVEPLRPVEPFSTQRGRSPPPHMNTEQYPSREDIRSRSPGHRPPPRHLEEGSFKPRMERQPFRSPERSPSRKDRLSESSKREQRTLSRGRSGEDRSRVTGRSKSSTDRRDDQPQFEKRSERQMDIEEHGFRPPILTERPRFSDQQGAVRDDRFRNDKYKRESQRNTSDHRGVPQMKPPVEYSPRPKRLSSPGFPEINDKGWDAELEQDCRELILQKRINTVSRSISGLSNSSITQRINAVDDVIVIEDSSDPDHSRPPSRSRRRPASSRLSPKLDRAGRSRSPRSKKPVFDRLQDKKPPVFERLEDPIPRRPPSIGSPRKPRGVPRGRR